MIAPADDTPPRQSSQIPPFRGTCRAARGWGPKRSGVGRVRVTIRTATTDDAPWLAALCGQLWYPTSVEQVEQRFKQIQEDEQHCVYVAELVGASPRSEAPVPEARRSGAERGAVVVGWIYVYLIHSLLDDPQAEIGGLIVDEGYRGQRVGEQLLKKVEQWAGEHGCYAVSVHSNVIRKDAHRFYGRLGYQVMKTQLVLRRVLQTTQK